MEDDWVIDWARKILDDDSIYPKIEEEYREDFEVILLKGDDVVVVKVPIDVIEITYEDGPFCEWVAKGNQSMEEMLEAVKYEAGDDYFDDEKGWVVDHCYMRCVPAGKYSEWSPGTIIYYRTNRGRGAFEATVLTVDYK